MYLIKTPLLLKKLYPNLIWNLDRAQNSIYLTFDDGPIPIVTPFVLKTLKQYNAKATFFCIGDNIQKHPDIFEQVTADGHAIGNHTFNHLRGWNTDTQLYADNFKQCDDLVHSRLFRPPYGRIKRNQISAIKELKDNVNIIMWDVLSGDFDIKLKPEVCLKDVLTSTEPGSIIVFHDSLKAFPRLEYVLPRALKYWAKKGYQFKALG
ncbi:polysaccharide deacetylase family protein [Mucilaginibacter sp. HMF5004]|uniref:polysaccharide deacetylase family protein n=1 Tax=Mucilaginibacter rivuli TaxID=2857527 RepID=UPI001C5FDEAE|nr:polysaccharide deacetylase family protein [Mucilaginibacter rivuli]MBW4888178.1 polysaccharide deacetylase family protein [Mucilaginibacter rivuli]